MGPIKQRYLDEKRCVACERQRLDVEMRNGWPLCAECQAELLKKFGAPGQKERDRG